MALYLTTAAVAALLPFVGAQTFSVCNPMEKTDCAPNPAIAENFQSDFRTGEGAFNGWTATAGGLTYEGDGAHFTINQQGQSTTIQTNGYFHYGRAEVRTRAAPGVGIVSSIVLQSESLDEIDWEFLGGVAGEVQVNYFGKGNVTTYDRMTRHPVENPQGMTHTYIVDWNAERTEFWIDSTRVRVLSYAEANGGNNYPQTPMNLRIGIWAGGDPNNEEGTIEWAGGLTDFSQAPFTQVLESVRITNYSPGSAYRWTDQSGMSNSIEVIDGRPSSNNPQPEPQPPNNGEENQDQPPSSPSPTSEAPASPVSTASDPPPETFSQAPAATFSAGSPDSPGGLGGGNGGNTSAASLSPTATAVLDCSADPSNSACSTAPLSTLSTATGMPSSNAGSTSTPSPSTGGAATPTGYGGVALAAGLLGVLMV